jgi:hypothetical protein
MPQLVVELEACHVELSHLLVSAADEADVETTCAAVQELLQTGNAALSTECSLLSARPFFPGMLCSLRKHILTLRAAQQTGKLVCSIVTAVKTAER